jgi:hypothetical protein
MQQLLNVLQLSNFSVVSYGCNKYSRFWSEEIYDYLLFCWRKYNAYAGNVYSLKVSDSYLIA